MKNKKINKNKIIIWGLTIALIISGFSNIILKNSVNEQNKYYTSVQKQDNLRIKELINNYDKLDMQNVKLSNEIQGLRITNKKLDELKTENLENYSIIFKSYDLRILSGASVIQLDALLEDTGLEGHGSSFKEAETKYGVNALALIAIAAHESAWGTSSLATKYNNLTGYTAYNKSVTKNATKFDNFHESIMKTAMLLATDYLSESGKYFNGYSFEAVNTRYSVLDTGEPNLQWSSINNKIAHKLRRDALQLIAIK